MSAALADRSLRLAALRSQLALTAPAGPRSALAIGIPALDRLLGGWPRAGIAEISGAPGSGRLGLVLPALEALTARGQEVALIDAAGTLYPPGLPGLDLAHTLLVRPGPTQVTWAAEQIARAGICPLVVVIDAPRLEAGRRLQLAAEAGGVSLIVVAPRADPRLPARLRLRCLAPGQVSLSKDGRGGQERVVELNGPPRPILPPPSRPAAQPPVSLSMQPAEGIDALLSGPWLTCAS